ncbi:hypothetical protein CJF42_07705 [Pseudoalteromonas sp. NBT06-2]|uniref:sensor domain-containing diguanylate cyclase n=1 Tax=Pseudoalteromonas sp. NBT06-2 TaxID=2025950 RepID=UPI000BA698DE|nr:sensor domain-containing diguanylate cyclase [Pseudoalteromonas sp. NBT06-2]PAJ74953.1 hypothetical protein CJF42_07705 [Pseudoalteromonas sp. NBT06-2]
MVNKNKSPIPTNESERLLELESYNIVDSLPEDEYDDIVLISSHICNTPIAIVALIDETRKWHKSKVGINKESVPRDIAICSHTILNDEILVVNDTHLNEKFCNIGMVTKAPFVRFYAGVPLINTSGFALGTLCVLDTKPNQLNDFQINSLKALARQVITLLELRRNLAQLEKQKHELFALSQTDDLSNLFNRRVLSRELSKELKRSVRYGGNFALMMLDLDYFKILNDKYGHAYGDKAIQKIGKLLKEKSRDTDCCIRYGGDEFIILMPNTNAEQAIYVSERIRQSIDKSGGALDTLSASIGIVIVQQFDVSEKSILALADDCVYLAKEQGRNQIIHQFI